MHLLDGIRIARGRVFHFALFHSVRQTKTRLPSLDFILELLHQVQKSDHGRVKFRVPQKPEASGSVERQLLVVSQNLSILTIQSRDLKKAQQINTSM